jgi:indole-3-glycerol phosphate synthase
MLEELYAGAIADANTREQIVSVKDLEQIVAATPAALDAKTYLAKANNIKVIAEIKRASPSKGHLSGIADAGELAEIYESAGCSAISVLTEERKFLGSLEDLKKVRSKVKVPILRKDFIATEYQVLEARAYGADMALLIIAGLNDPQLRHLFSFVQELGMTALVETHTVEEVQRANDLGAQLVGINTRDLTTFETNRHLFADLAALIDPNSIKIAESAVRNVADVIEYASSGADAVLVGEALVTGDAKTLIPAFTAVTKE